MKPQEVEAVLSIGEAHDAGLVGMQPQPEFVLTATHRVLWGTDWPHPNVRHMPDDGDLLDLLYSVAPDERVRNTILVDNPARLYPFAT